MNYILLGAAGFLLVHVMDLASLKRLPVIKPVLSVGGTVLIGVSLAMVAVADTSLIIPSWLSFTGWAVFGLALLATVYSLYFALPAVNTYIAPGTSGTLVTSGVYSLVRHPWLLFFTLTMIGLTVGSRSLLALEAGIIWTLLSIALVILQDRAIFPRMFPGYAQYRASTPMFIPTKQSVSTFINGFKQNKVSEV